MFFFWDTPFDRICSLDFDMQESDCNVFPHNDRSPFKSFANIFGGGHLRLVVNYNAVSEYGIQLVARPSVNT